MPLTPRNVSLTLTSLSEGILLSRGFHCLAILAIFLSLSATTTSAEYFSPTSACPCPPSNSTFGRAVRAGDEVFLVSTRALPSHCQSEMLVGQMRVKRYDPALGWQPDSLAALTEKPSPGGQTQLLMHGNWMDAAWTERRGWEMYHQLIQGLPENQPIRYIIWSWPSDRQPKPLRTTRQNASRSDDEAFYVGWLLSQLPREERVSLIGFSLGARVLSGGLHLLGGGTLRGRALPDHESNTHGYRVAFWAGAVSVSSPTLYGSRQQAWDQVDSLLNIFNSADPVLRRYHLVTRQKGDRAIGLNGIYVASADNREKLTQLNACRIVGKDHAWDRYIGSPTLMQRTRAQLTWPLETEVADASLASK
ncbi:MAG: hypothetical protein WDZ51_12415 [Pirellulaceae bacterium]